MFATWTGRSIVSSTIFAWAGPAAATRPMPRRLRATAKIIPPPPAANPQRAGGFHGPQVANMVNPLAACNKTQHGRDGYKPPRLDQATTERRTRLKLDPPDLAAIPQPEASCNQAVARAAPPLARSGTRFLRKPVIRRFTETRLIRAYMDLFFAPPLDDGSKVISLARFGCYEVRLFELAHDTSAALPLWIELYAHDTHATLDSFGCDDFEAAVTVAGEFMTRAEALHEEP